MNDCYWGGVEDQYYYEVDSGRIVGQIIPNSDYVYKAFYFDAWNNSLLGDYIDSTRAKKVVETARQRDVEKWERMRKAWNSAPPAPPEPPPARKINFGTWWKFWK